MRRRGRRLPWNALWRYGPHFDHAVIGLANQALAVWSKNQRGGLAVHTGQNAERLARVRIPQPAVGGDNHAPVGANGDRTRAAAAF